MEAKFTKSLSNKKTEGSGLDLLCRLPHFQGVDAATKTRILTLVDIPGEWGIRTFDAVMTSEPAPPLTVLNVDDWFSGLVLVEMKVTQKPIRNASLNGFFFGATEREFAMAKALGDRYRFAFVVLNTTNDYGVPFAVLLSLDEVEVRTRVKRVQYQVNFRSDLDNITSPAALLLSPPHEDPSGP